MSATNGNGKHGVFANLSNTLIRALPPAFLVLTLMNIAFLASTMWIVTHNADQRTALLTKIVENCLLRDQAPR